MDQMNISALAVAQNASFIDAIKKTESCRDKPLQITERVGGGITIEGYRCVRFSVLAPIFSKHAKNFVVTFSEYNNSVKIECYENTNASDNDETQIPSVNSSLQESITVILGATPSEHMTSGAINTITYDVNSISSKTTARIFQLQSVLDVELWPDKLKVNTIGDSNNKGGIRHLKETNTTIFRKVQACRRQYQRSEKLGHAKKKKNKKEKKSFFAFLH